MRNNLFLIHKVSEEETNTIEEAIEDLNSKFTCHNRPIVQISVKEVSNVKHYIKIIKGNG